MIVIEAILMGLAATFIMDLAAGFLAKKGLIQSFITPDAIGRWFLYLLRGKLFHADIEQTPALNNEKRWCLISHYLIGIFLAALYLFLDATFLFIQEKIWLSFLFGVFTIVLPWLWLFPSIGLGVMARKSPHQVQIAKTSMVNHSNFGIGLLLWMIVCHPFFI